MSTCDQAHQIQNTCTSIQLLSVTLSRIHGNDNTQAHALRVCQANVLNVSLYFTVYIPSRTRDLSTGRALMSKSFTLISKE